MAMPETASMAIIIAGGVHAGRVDGDAAPRSRAGAATVGGSALRWPNPSDERSPSWPDFSLGLGDRRRSMMNLATCLQHPNRRPVFATCRCPAKGWHGLVPGCAELARRQPERVQR
jgi:hypothetical protein